MQALTTIDFTTKNNTSNFRGTKTNLMKQLLRLIPSMMIIFIIPLSSFSQTLQDEKDIHALFDKMSEAWSAGDYGYTKYDVLDDSAILINPVGMYWKNKNEIIKGLQYLGEVRFKYLKFTESKTLSLRFLSSTVALAVIYSKDVVTEDFTMPGEKKVTKKGTVSEGFETHTLIKKNNKWKLASLNVVEIVK